MKLHLPVTSSDEDSTKSDFEDLTCETPKLHSAFTLTPSGGIKSGVNVGIWEERKVFGSRGQILKEELVGRHVDNTNKNGKHSGFKLKHPSGNVLDKIVSGYQVVYGGQLDEDAILNKCRNAISCVEKVDMDIHGDIRSGQFSGPGIAEELKGYHAVLSDCIDQLTAVESSRANLVSHLREALQEQEYKLNHVRNQLQQPHLDAYVPNQLSTTSIIIWSGQFSGPGIAEELKGYHAVLSDCIDQLTAVESSRANLVSHLREALQEQEYKLNHVRNQLQAAQSQSEQAGNICRNLLNSNNVQLPAEQSLKEIHTSRAPQGFIAGNGEQSAPVMYTRQVPFAEKSIHAEEDPKSAAAAVAAKLTASTSSAQMLTYVLSSLASEGVIGNSTKESSSDYPSEKRPKLENDHSSYIPPQNPQAVPPFPHSGPVQHNIPLTSQELTSNEQPPPPSSPPPLPPLPPMQPPMQPYPLPQFRQTAGSIPSGPYGYGATQQQLPPLPGYPTVGIPTNGISPFTAPPANIYQGYPAEGSFYSQPTSLPMAPITRQ
ncbi:unnamed protein product [Ilex paraguariensis]|uniref:Uncharacterized protein n=1 Tax=Ilex paraguariensis TaxID=185542 RepID=A0ABC8TR82_9AQUA